MTRTYPAVRIRVELWDAVLRPSHGSPRMLAQFERDTCENTAHNRHIICPECGATWATQCVWRIKMVNGHPLCHTTNWTVSIRRCPTHGDGSLIGAPDVYQPRPEDCDLTALVKRELLLPCLTHIYGLPTDVEEPTL